MKSCGDSVFWFLTSSVNSSLYIFFNIITIENAIIIVFSFD